MKDKTYKELESELSQILDKVEHADYDELDELLADYESGKKLISELEKRLETAKNKVKKVKA